MPYIDLKDREQLNPLIDKLADELVKVHKKYKYDGAFSGLLNYTITRLSLNIVKNAFGHLRYWLVAMLTGTMHNAADEFYRRIASKYEDKQMKKSGDVDIYKEFIEDIEHD